jgi:hypothetical protein
MNLKYTSYMDVGSADYGWSYNFAIPSLEIKNEKLYYNICLLPSDDC